LNQKSWVEKSKRGANKYVAFLAVNDFARVTAYGTSASTTADTLNLINIVAQRYQNTLSFFFSPFFLLFLSFIIKQNNKKKKKKKKI